MSVWFLWLSCICFISCDWHSKNMAVIDTKYWCIDNLQPIDYQYTLQDIENIVLTENYERNQKVNVCTLKREKSFVSGLLVYRQLCFIALQVKLLKVNYFCCLFLLICIKKQYFSNNYIYTDQIYQTGLTRQYQSIYILKV